MTIEQELLEVRDYFKSMNETIDRLVADRMALLPSGIRYDIDKVQTSPIDRMSEIMAELVDAEKEMFKDMPRMINKRTYIINACKRMKYGELIKMYYIDIMSWQYIADYLGITKSRLYYTLRPKALMEYEILTTKDNVIKIK